MSDESLKEELDTKMTEISDTEGVFDPLSKQFSQNPYAAYEKLRAAQQPLFFAPAQAVLLANYSDVDSVARNPNMVRVQNDFLSEAQLRTKQREANWHDMPNHSRFVQFSLLDSDGEVHKRLRLLVLREFSRQFVARHQQMIKGYVEKLCDTLLERRTFDFVEDLAAHVPGHIIGNVLGVPDEDCPQLRLWSEDVVQFFDVARTQAHKQTAERATTEFYLYLKDLIKLRRVRPKQDLLSTLIAAEQAEELDETELISTCMLVLMAGHGSTIDVLGTGMYALLEHSAEFARLRENPELLPCAVQEMFRYESPLPFFHRYANEEVEVMGHRYPQGTKFGLLYGAANRDPLAFEDPDRFDVGRVPNRHVAFGRGAHLCLGNNLARLDMEIIFNTLMKRTKEIALINTQVTYKRGLAIRGLESLLVELTPV